MESKIWKKSCHYSDLIRLSDIGKHVGYGLAEMIQMKEKPGKRETRILGILYYVNSIVWKYVFGKQADSLEKSTENADECINYFYSRHDCR